MSKRLHSAKSSQQLSARDIASDRRSEFKRLTDSFNENVNARWVVLALLAACFFYPLALYIGIPVAFILTMMFSSPTAFKDDLPLNLPGHAGDVIDPKDPEAGGNNKTGFRFHKARAWFYLGNDLETGQQVWTHHERLLEHYLVAGTTGSGKTVKLVGMAFGYLCLGGTFSFNDAKGTTDLAWTIQGMLRYLGRDDDMRVINLMGAGDDSDSGSRLSNKSNLYEVSGVDDLNQLTVELISSGEDGGANKVFLDKAIAAINAFLPAAVELRDKGIEPLSAGRLRWYLEYGNLNYFIKHEDVSSSNKAKIQAFLSSISGYQEGKSLSAQSSETKLNYGYAQGYLVRSLSTLADVYGHVFETTVSDFDFAGFAFNNIVPVSLLPASTKSEEEVALLGKILFAMLKGSTVHDFKIGIEGRRNQIIDGKLSNYSAPIALIQDEASFLLPSGSAITVAQLRSLMVSVIVSVQEMSGLHKRLGREETEMYISNTGVKSIMAMNDTNETKDMVTAIAGETWILVKDGFESIPGVSRTKSRDKATSSYQKVAVVDTRDLSGLNKGEEVTLVKGRHFFTQVFYVGFGKDDKEVYPRSYRVPRPALLRNPKRGSSALSLVMYAHAISSELTSWWDNAKEETKAELSKPLRPPQQIASAVTALKKYTEEQLLDNIDDVVNFLIARKDAGAQIDQEYDGTVGNNDLPEEGAPGPDEAADNIFADSVDEVPVSFDENKWHTDVPEAPSVVATNKPAVELSTVESVLEDLASLPYMQAMRDEAKASVSIVEKSLGRTDEQSKDAQESIDREIRDVFSNYPTQKIELSDSDKSILTDSLRQWIGSLDPNKP